MTATLESRMANLEHANETRRAIAKIKANIAVLSPAVGRRTVAGLLREPSVWVALMRVEVLLGSVRRLGPVAVADLLRFPVGVRSHDRRVQDLSERQRLMLAERLERRRDERSADVPFSTAV
jgi:hypothetical protein